MSKSQFNLGDAVEVYQELSSVHHHICYGTVTRIKDTMIVVINQHGDAMTFKEDLTSIENKDSLLRLMPKSDDPIQWDRGLQYYSGDDVAETLSVSDALYRRLYELIATVGNPTPRGGDGSDGTVETPDGQIGDYDDNIPAIWKHLTNDERQEINTAYRTHLNAINELMPFKESLAKNDL